MFIAYIDCLRSEWLKTRHTIAALLIICGAAFTPTIILAARLIYNDRLPQIYQQADFWITHWRSAWESMAIFLLPIGTVLVTSLLTQIEFKNNTWKQLHTLPVSMLNIYFAKLSVIIVMLIQFFILFDLAVILFALIPPVIFSDVPFPDHPPIGRFLNESFWYFLDVLPVAALQFAISLKFRNFMVPLGIGFILWVLAVAVIRWKFGYLLPFTYPMYTYLEHVPNSKAVTPSVNIHVMAAGYFIFFVVGGYILYATRRDRS